MAAKLHAPKIELKGPNTKKRDLTGNLVERSELPEDFKDFNRFSEKNQPKYIGSRKKK